MEQSKRTRSEISIAANKARWKKYNWNKGSLKTREGFEAFMKNIDWSDWQRTYDEECANQKELAEKVNQNFFVIRFAFKFGFLKANPLKRKMSQKTKQIISEKRKKWLADNPEKHPWKRKDKYISVPCEKVKKFLTERGILFIEEFSPRIENRFFSIDIAFPDKKIGIEINGNQHYNRNGTLKLYYKNRKEVLERNGWKIFDLHYSLCFDEGKIISTIESILNNVTVDTSFDYEKYLSVKNIDENKKKEIQKLVWEMAYSKVAEIFGFSIQKFKSFCKANNITLPPKFHWNKHGSHVFNRPSKRPPKEELEKLVAENPLIKIAKTYGVSDNAVKKWCKLYGIKTHPPGYWAKKQAGKI